jgi:aromatic ring-opening dioxygenase LigB subunit
LKPTEVQFDEEAYNEYQALQDKVVANKKARGQPTYEQLLSSINNAIKNLKANPHYGDLIPRRNITKKVINRYGTDKVFRIELVGFWRMLYTLVGDETKIVAFILEYMDHDKYNKIFDYRKK